MRRRLGLTVALIVTVALPLCADIPTQLPHERIIEPLGAEEFIVFMTVERSADEAEVLLFFEGEEAAEGFYALRVTGASTELHRVRQGEAQLTHRGPPVLPAAGESFELTVRQRGPHLVAGAGGPASAHFLTEHPGSARVGAQAVRGAAVRDLFVQPIGDVTFDEDFFAVEQVPDRWETLLGGWEVGIYWDPLQERDDRPIGASWYEPGEGVCLTAAGHEFFDSYRLGLTMRPAQGSGGVAFHVRGPRDYCLFEVGAGVARLVEVSDGKRTVLAETPIDLRPEWWYRLQVDVSTGHARGFVNGEPLAEARLCPALTGRIGIYADEAVGSRFDDVEARPFSAVRVPQQGRALQVARAEQGAWQIEQGVLRGHSRAPVVVPLPGDCGEGEVSAQVSATRDAVAGVVAGHSALPPRSALIFSIRASEQPTWHLHHVAGEETVRLAGGPAPAAEAHLKLRLVGGSVICMLNGNTVHEQIVPLGGSGTSAGVFLQGGRANFTELAWRELDDEPQSIISHLDGANSPVPALQRQEMVPPLPHLWRPVSGNWRCRQIDGRPLIVATGDEGFQRPALRFQEIVPGEPRLMVEPAEGLATEITLGICMGEEPGYEAQFDAAQSFFRLLRHGELIHESEAGSAGSCAPGEIRRDGDRVIVGARSGGQMRMVHVWRDPDPLPDGRVQVRTEGSAQLQSITLASNSALMYGFDRVEPDWQPRSGEWTDHTGMACLLWDYWLTGDGREEPGFTWNRHALPEDVTVDLSVAEFTEGFADGRHEHFPYHDISVILGGTPGAPDEGYRFIVGADGGARNLLLRNGEEVASNDERRFRIVMGGHCNTPRAVRIRAQKQGDTLTLVFNGAEVIRWSDPSPLTGGGHVGMGIDGCRAIFRDCVIYPDPTGDS